MRHLALRAAALLIANAIAIVLAAVLLDHVSIDVLSTPIVVLVFTALQLAAAPLVVRALHRWAAPAEFAASLVATLVGLVVTAALLDGFDVRGLDGWLVATILVWALAGIALVVTRRQLGVRPQTRKA